MGRASGKRNVNAAGGARRGGRPLEWTDERILTELQALTADTDEFPTQKQLRAAGHSGLAIAISNNGGWEVWSQRLGLRLRRAQRVVSYPEPYTDARAFADAERLIAEHGELPGANKLRQLDHPRLAAAVYRAGGAAAFCRAHGLA